MTLVWQETGTRATVWRFVRDAGAAGVKRGDLSAGLGNSVSRGCLGVMLNQLHQGKYIKATRVDGGRYRYTVTPGCARPVIVSDQPAAEHARRKRAFTAPAPVAQDAPLHWHKPPNSIFDAARVLGLSPDWARV